MAAEVVDVPGKAIIGSHGKPKAMEKPDPSRPINQLFSRVKPRDMASARATMLFVKIYGQHNSMGHLVESSMDLFAEKKERLEKCSQSHAASQRD